MKQDSITLRQGQSLLVLFVFGSSVVVGVSSGAGNDAWVSLVLSVLISIPMLCVYARIMRLYPEMDLFEIMEQLFGKVISKMLTLLMTWYAIHLCALVLRNFTEFIEITAMPETPQLPIMIMMLLVTAYLARSGLRTLGKWSVPMLFFVLFVVVFTVLASLRNMEFSNIQPMFAHSVGIIAKNAVQIYSFPFAETVLFLFFAKGVKKQDSPYRLYLLAFLFAALILLIVMLRNLFILGPKLMAVEYFPSLAAARIIRIGDFLTRIEGSISLNFIIAGIAKITVCLLAASRGMAYVTGVQNHKILILPVGLFTVALGSIVYQSTMEMFGFLDYYWVYAAPFQFLIPTVVWIAAEIKSRRSKNRNFGKQKVPAGAAAGD